MEIQILEQTPEDVLEVYYLLKKTWLETYPNVEHGISREDILARYDESGPEFQEKIRKRKESVNKEPNICSWVAKADGKIVGFCSALKGEQIKIGALYVLSEYQGQKIGWKLIKHALDWFGDVPEIYVNVASYNQKAINFYEKVGFKKTGKTLTEEVGRLPSGAIIPEIEMVKRS